MQANQLESVLKKHTPDVITTQDATDELSSFLKTTGKASDKTWAAMAGKSREVAIELDGKTNFDDLTIDQRKGFRSDIYLLGETIAKLNKQHKIADASRGKAIGGLSNSLQAQTKYIPTWVKFAVALALGLGTMIGWKRIVVTVGEKIGKEHLTYAQGASAELVAMLTIWAGRQLWLTCKHDPRVVIGNCRNHVRKSFGIASRYAAQHFARLGIDAASLRHFGCRNFLGLLKLILLHVFGMK